MNAIHQISLKLRLGIDTRANIRPEVLLKKWQALNGQKLSSDSPGPSSRDRQAGALEISGSHTVERKLR